MKLSIPIIVLSVAFPFAIAAAEGPPAPPHHHQPPKEAFEACASARHGDACTVNLRDLAIDGVCAPFPGTAALVCRPNHPPVPPEAVEACQGAAEGDSCSFDNIAGRCAYGPDGNGPLACKPEHRR